MRGVLLWVFQDLGIKLHRPLLEAAKGGLYYENIKVVYNDSTLLRDLRIRLDFERFGLEGLPREIRFSCRCEGLCGEIFIPRRLQGLPGEIWVSLEKGFWQMVLCQIRLARRQENLFRKVRVPSR